MATIDAIWKSPLAIEEPSTVCTASGMPLQLFIRETLRRSRTSCSTLQAALLYCLRAAPAVKTTRLRVAHAASGMGDKVIPAILLQPLPAGIYQHLLCGRRIFLAAVMVASKFLQDRNYSNKAWSKITGLPLKELAAVEREFLAALKWDLNVKPEEWQSWTRKLAQAKLNRACETASAPATSPAFPAHLPRCVTAILEGELSNEHAVSAMASSPTSFSSSSTTTMGTPTPAAKDNAPSVRQVLARSTLCFL